jgi:hypothetical protein
VRNDTSSLSDWGPGPEHQQAIAHLGDETVLVDHELVELIELLKAHGICTRYSCQQVVSPHGAWRDQPDVARFYVALSDVEDLRRLLPLLAESDTLMRSIRPSLGSPRWEYTLSVHGRFLDGPLGDEGVRLQASIFVPRPQLEILVSVLRESLRAHQDAHDL